MSTNTFNIKGLTNEEILASRNKHGENLVVFKDENHFLNAILKFLKDLSKHNDREWFEKNKSRYLEVKQGFEDLVGSILHELIKFDGGLAGLNYKNQ